MNLEIKDGKPTSLIPDGLYTIKKASTSRSLNQNNSLWLWYTQVAETLNEAGLDVRTFLKDGVEVPWNKNLVHDLMWIKLQIVMTGKESTKEINTEEMNKIMDVIIRTAGERKVELPPFPSIDYILNNLDNPSR
jgi:hypothetical protein